ncbi:hypothetical protein F2P56_002690 [Juglans regia]|uniref:Trimethyltridecatetraene synthase-like n=2 Tax=Juglans regia TaxID=51240 RepID=A0A833Y2H5_JUGRE|nr:trimethyltridecatetraene synthase-like [Juglans regia]KAF5482096.1 hypothetical protein F2P56_002690 [Juglans regia]
MEVTTSWVAVLAMAIILLAALLLSFSKNPSFRSHKYLLKPPPGPKPWPIIGNLNLIGPLPHQSLYRLSQEYGPIMQLKFGSFPVVVASSPTMAKEFLKTHDHIFASRPQSAAGKYTSYNHTDLTWAPYGPYLRQARKLFQSELFSSKRLESFEYIRVEERCALVSRLCTFSGKPIKVIEHLSHLTLSVISRITLGKNYFKESESGTSTGSTKLEEFQEILDELLLLNGVLNIGDWIPWLDFLDLQGYVRRMKAVMEKLDQVYDHVLDEHKARMGGKGFVPKDMVDLLLQMADNPSVDVKLTCDNIKGLIQDLIAGGTDTSASMVEWAMSELLKQPHLIKIANEELDRIIGKQKWVEEKDIPQLPFIDAIMKETMRKHPAAVLLAPHLAQEDCKVAGYDIRKGTRIFINVWGMGRDSTIWDAPREFRPERFLGKAIDVKGNDFELLPFGSGRRRCPGYSLGLKMISSTLANMLHGFEWTLPDNMKPEDLSMEEVYGLITHRKFPLVAVVKPRLEPHLY